MAEFQIIPASEHGSWKRVLARCGAYDVFHLPELHQLSERLEGGTARLLAYEDEDGCAALPLIVRRVAEVEGLNEFDFEDAISVYGYTGAVTSLSRQSPQASQFRDRFQGALREATEQMRLVSLVVRTHPLIANNWLLDGWAQIYTAGPIVAIDLSEPDEIQEQNYSNRVRRDLKNAIRRGVRVEEVPFLESIDVFMSIYSETMARNQARDYYFFPREFYVGLKHALGESVRMYIADVDGRPISVAICFALNECIHIHLAGSATWALDYSAVKVIIDHVRSWGRENGFRWFNLGGGVNSAHDSLLEFKLGFRKRTYDFQLAKVVTNHSHFHELSRIRTEYIRRHGLESTTVHFFPEYRRPINAPSPRPIDQG